MLSQHQPPAFRPFAIIAGVVVVAATVFAWTAGWLSPKRMSPEKFLQAMQPAGGPALGYRRNHAKGICFSGQFEANGAGTTLSTAQVFAAGRYPIIGRFNLAGGDPHMADATGRIRGLGVRISTPDGREWRSALIDAPFFAASTPQVFLQVLNLSSSKDPNAAATLAAAHPEFGAFGAWAKGAPWTASYAEERYNSINSFVFVNAQGTRRTVRWSYLPAAQPLPVAATDLEKLGADFLEQDLRTRVAAAPLRFTLVVTVAAAGDPTADPSKPWPPEREAVDVGTLVVQQVQAERDGPCRDINFDPTVLPPGMQTSDDPFPAARSAVYARSYDKRTAETAYYPYAEAKAP
jgi:catalase